MVLESGLRLAYGSLRADLGAGLSYSDDLQGEPELSLTLSWYDKGVPFSLWARSQALVGSPFEHAHVVSMEFEW